jgi:hypothetical protein
VTGGLFSIFTFQSAGAYDLSAADGAHLLGRQIVDAQQFEPCTQRHRLDSKHVAYVFEGKTDCGFRLPHGTIAELGRTALGRIAATSSQSSHSIGPRLRGPRRSAAARLRASTGAWSNPKTGRAPENPVRYVRSATDRVPRIRRLPGSDSKVRIEQPVLKQMKTCSLDLPRAELNSCWVGVSKLPRDRQTEDRSNRRALRTFASAPTDYRTDGCRYSEFNSNGI